METHAIHDNFIQNVASNRDALLCQENMKFVIEIIELIKIYFHVRSVEKSMGTIDEPFGYNVHVRGISHDSLYMRVGSKGINVENNVCGYQQPSENLSKDIIAYCDNILVRRPN